MPSITFLWYSKQVADSVVPIIGALRAVADEYNVSFTVNVTDEEEKRPVVVNDEVVLDQAGVERLTALAGEAGATIYVNPPEP